MNRRRVVAIVGALAILSGFGYLVVGGIGENLVYFVTPTELLARGDAAHDAPIRLGGQVQPGSVRWNADKLDLRFTLTDGLKTVPVQSRGAPPQMFRDGMGVVVEGRYDRSGVFQSTNLMIKHSNEYRAPHEGEKPQEAYKTLIKP